MTSQRPPFPFCAIVGQEEMKRALLLNLVHPEIGGALLLGQRGTAKSTAVRALADLLPALDTLEGCPLGCTPEAPWCRENPGVLPCRVDLERPCPRSSSVPVVDLPLGSTEDRVLGSIELEAALLLGRKSFEPGLLARAHRGFLYIDEANLLEDHLVDLLLDVSASGENVVERESLSVRHPARFQLVGSANPEEGDIRPQLLDRFGLCADIKTEDDLERRLEITRRRLAFDADAQDFVASHEAEQEALRTRISAARAALPEVSLPDSLLRAAASINACLQVPGHRGELTLCRAARAQAALQQRSEAQVGDLRAVALLSLRHRLPGHVLAADERDARIQAALAEALPES